MIFWILIAAIAIITVWIAIDAARPYSKYSSWDLAEGFGCGVAALAVSTLVAVVAFILTFFVLAACGFPTVEKVPRTVTYDLRAINTGSTIEGHFFLGSGTFDGKRVFSYIYEDGPWTHLGQADADQSRVAEDAEPDTAYMLTTIADFHIWWLAPWNIGHTIQHDFHVPAESVIESYEISAE